MRRPDYDVLLGAAIILCGMNGKCAECKYFTEKRMCGLDGISGAEMPHDALCVAMALKRARKITGGGGMNERLYFGTHDG